MSQQEPPSAADRPPRQKWTIKEVRGRHSSHEKGLAAASSITLQGLNGSHLNIQRAGFNDRHGVGVEYIALAEPMKFDRCPICLTPDPTTDEHVPPKSLGGSVMTSTCERCNNRFGSLLEATLTSWWEDAVGSVAFSHEEVRGARRTSRILHRQTEDGEFALLLDRGKMDREIQQKMVVDSTITMTYSLPDPRRYRLAAMKSAYLGACLITKSIPETAEANAIRDELMDVRELDSQQRPKISPLCRDLMIAKSQGPSTPGEIALVQTRPPNGGRPMFAISLARTLLVSWPIGGFLAVEKSGKVTDTFQM
ncbi:HNH endonuclease [Streptomyces platensis]|uniref:HNH endonuclease n=1 Tax=Streptomyces platensis TaxID=58346 RepID=UPI0022524DEF|nr:HNH endonuclease [Streptomyces platensis]MCX4639895.1 HNH endonuclease [Streptomyces platensis]